MRTKALLQAAVAGCLLFLSIAGMAVEAGDQRVLISDPDLLARVGYAPDAQHVYASAQVWESLSGQTSETAAAQPDPVTSASPRGTVIQVKSVHATDFLPVRVSNTTSYGSTGNEER